MVRIAICDDNKIHLRQTDAQVRSALSGKNADIRLYGDADVLLEELKGGIAVPDIAVLDIQMESMDGISLAEELNRLLPACQIIFLTGYADYAPEVYRTKHVWFVLKDRAKEYLPEAVKTAMSNMSNDPSPVNLVFRVNRITNRISLQDVVIIERVGRKYSIICRTETYRDIKLVSDLREPQIRRQLIRCHQGYWANEPHIRMLERGELVMDNGMRVPISRTYRSQVRERFFDARRL